MASRRLAFRTSKPSTVVFQCEPTGGRHFLPSNSKSRSGVCREPLEVIPLRAQIFHFPLTSSSILERSTWLSGRRSPIGLSIQSYAVSIDSESPFSTYNCLNFRRGRSFAYQ